jgi:hypothetical protein
VSRLQRLWPTIQAVLGNPKANPQMAFAVFAMAAILVVLVLMIIYTVFVMPSSAVLRRSKATSGGAGATPRKRRPPIRIPALVIVLLALAAVGSGYWTATRPAMCTSCHRATAVIDTAAQDAHRTVACISCHGAPGVTGFVDNVTELARMAVRKAAGAPADGVSGSASNAACLSCHGRAISRTVTGASLGLRMSHTAPLAQGMTCVECHRATGHTGKRISITMNVCLPCHDGKRAPSTCGTCHVKDPQLARATDGVVYPKLEVANRDCGGCHTDQRTCDSCHGIRMPHSDEFKAGGHAKPAAFDGKKACFRCHQTWECDKCHMPFASGHPIDWKTQHAKAPSTSGCGCHSARTGSTKPFCATCH